VPFVHDGAVNGVVFQTYIERVLVPTLRPGDIVIHDNLMAHRMLGARRAVEQAEVTMMFLPPYSTDFNPIEMAFFKLKSPACGAGRNAPSRHSGMPSETSFRPSRRSNAPTSLLPAGYEPD